jgi:predicted transcriptional regulator
VDARAVAKAATQRQTSNSWGLRRVNRCVNCEAHIYPEEPVQEHQMAGDEDRAPRMQDVVRLSAEGIAKVLGDLEARVMRTIWALGRPAPAREVHERVIEEHEVAHLTVVTVLNKLVGKRLLAREKQGGVFHYYARWSEDAFRAHVSRRAVEGILSLGPEAVTTSFVDVLAEQDPERLAALERLIRERVREGVPDE